MVQNQLWQLDNFFFLSPIGAGFLYMVVEYAPYGNLREFLRSRRPSVISTKLTNESSEDLTPAITIRDFISFAFQISRGMEHLAAKKVSKLFIISFNLFSLLYYEMYLHNKISSTNRRGHCYAASRMQISTLTNFDAEVKLADFNTEFKLESTYTILVYNCLFYLLSRFQRLVITCCF